MTNSIRAFFLRFLDVLRDGVAMFWLAPLIVAIIVVPEFIQHVVEIRLGMFESKSAFNSLADSPERMVWGYLKIAGLFLSILATIRFWGAHERGQKWWNARGLAWANLLIAAGLLVALSLPEYVLTPMIGAQYAGYLSLAITLATLPIMVLLVAGLSGDKETGLKSVFRTGWAAAVRILLYAAAVFLPLQWLHGKNHSWALGQSDAVVWALMIFDTLIVGLLAMMAGTAFHHGYSMGDRKETQVT